MKLPNELIGGSLLVLFLCITFLVRYVRVWRAEVRSTQMRLNQVEEEVQRHAQNCPVKQQMEGLTRPRPVLPEKNSMDSIELVRHYIQLYYPKFMDILSRHTSEKLTNSDEMLCMMIKLEYSNKEIAAILSITTNSVITARYRLKRKLSLLPDEQLDEWIHAIGMDEKKVDNYTALP